jgi:hypothetical protein
VQDGTDDRLEQRRDQRAAIIEVPRHVLAVQEGRQRSFRPRGVAKPVALRREDDQQASVVRAAEGDRPVGNREDVLPEGVAGAIRLHRLHVVFPP